jgi:ketosteroid isomerase-like protein
MDTMITTSTDVFTEIQKVNDIFSSTFEMGDAAKLAKLYTEDALLLPANSECIRNRTNIENFWQNSMDQGVKHVKTEAIELEQYQNSAVELGNYEMLDQDGMQVDKGKYIIEWKLMKGQWKMNKDIWTSSLDKK